MAQEPTVAPNPNGHMQRPADGIDPGVKMPPHVLAAMARSNEAHKAAFSPDPAAPNGEGHVQTPPAPTTLPNGTPAPTPPTHVPAAPAGNGELSETNADGTPNYENMYKALRGRQDGIAKRHREAQEATEARLRELTEQVTRLQQPPLPGVTFDPKNPPRLVTEQEVQEYGADLIDVIRRTATETVMPMIAPIATKVGEVEGQAQINAKETERQFLSRMHGTMHATVPGWETINEDPKFIDWTKRQDVYSGLNRQELLQRAWNNGDPHRVAAFFKGFLAEEAATDPAAAEARQRALADIEGHAPPAPTPGQPVPNGQPQAAPRVTLEQLAAPGRARAAVVPPAGKAVWTAAGIASFYQDIAAGKFRGRDAERIATEADLMAAQREGRIEVNPRTATFVGR